MTVPFQLKLVDEELWAEFEARGNEMIVTKNGRCMFPLLKLNVLCHDNDLLYGTIGFSVSIERCDEFRWKFREGEWRKSGLDEEELEYASEHHFEPEDSPNSGQYWVENGVSFSKIKLTNRPDTTRLPPPSNYFCLSSFRRYRPIVRCTIYGPAGKDQDMIISMKLPHTEFIAVTHYQNERVTELKKNYNPHAKGFLSQPSSPLILRQGYTFDDRDDISAEDLTASWILGSMKRANGSSQGQEEM